MNETPTKCREKWKKIRENFRKASNLRKTKSGQAAKNFKPIRFAKELSFLTPYIHAESQSLSNVPAQLSDDEEHSFTSSSSVNIASPAHGSSTMSPGSPISKTPPPKKKKPTESLPGSTQSLFQSYLDKKYSHDRQEEEDPIITFFKNLGHTVSQFFPDLRLRVKRAVFNIVCEAEEENIQRNATVNMSTPIASGSSSRQEYATDVDGSSSRQSYIILNTSQLQSVEGTSQMATSPLQSQTQNYASPLNEYIRFQK
ncbi:unnamed protein product [Parnassius apollo]|uniref:(apollo) hypothetical protein n=1 Tax=Parnassius apollo TaxID=110799 RepID=A0A8S3X586_PARAO|nr:unnamed protein product [Parnassius apollo]